ncbi:hypothetical protein FOA52_006833 [Chlamydomonas sp. UWO 241]|nr:hypothetical protein FOA52_006833 [Chlamydomonas sp. UWO 241]
MGLTTLHDVLAGFPGAAGLVLTGGGGKCGRAELYAAVVDTASRLRAAGVKPGDVVSMAFANTIDFVVAFLGVTFARAVAAPLNAGYTADEFLFYLEDTSSKLLLLPASGNKAAEQAAAKHRVPIATLSVAAVDGGRPAVSITPATPGPYTFPPPSPSPRLAELPSPSDLALFFHTSGTTGRPKAVPLTHANIVASLANIQETYELCPSDVSYLVMPLFHVHGLMAGLLAPLASGSSVVLPKEGKFTAHVFWKDCCAHGATFYTAVPTMHQVLLARADKEYPAASPPPLRFIRSCSASLAAATLERLEATFKVPVLEAYAMSEASHQMTSSPLPKHGVRKPGSVGKAQGSVSVAVLDANHQAVPTGKIGEVCIRGPNVTSGYWNNDKANAEAYAGGWFHTGDQGWLDAEGYLTLTGRIKELINRGGEKISPLEVDNILLGHPAVAEACCFGAPDEKYGEVVAAAVVLRPEAEGQSAEAIEASVKAHCAAKVAAFKVPIRVFVTKALPKGATGKVQRRIMASHFMPNGAGAAGGPASAPPKQPAAAPASSASSSVPGVGDGYEVTAQALARLGVKYMFGVVGIPVTPLASSAQAAGIRYIGFRNEQSAGYAAAAAGFLTGTPAVLLTVSGPGAVHGIAGLSHAQANCFPLIQISGSCEQSEVGKGAFQECDQVAAVSQFCKYAGAAHKLSDIPSVLAAAFQASATGRPGASYVDLPSNVLLQRLPQDGLGGLLSTSLPPGVGEIHRGAPPPADVASVAALLRSAKRPLIVVGKGAAMSPGCAEELRALVNQLGIPVLATSMGRGLLPDAHPLCANAARSDALRGADVALIVGTRLNWQLHFGEAPKWWHDVRFALADVAPSARDRSLASATMVGDAAACVRLLRAELSAGGQGAAAAWGAWGARLSQKAASAGASLALKLSAPPKCPLDYYTTLGIIRSQLATLPGPTPLVVSEGANTMDMARLLLPVTAPRTRIDAGTWGTMGVGPGGAIAGGVCHPERLTLAIEGDSAFGFSGMEVETIVRYNLPVVLVIMNNGGIYGGDRRTESLTGAAAAGAARGGFGSDPVPTAFVPGARHDQLMAAFGGRAFRATNATELAAACVAAFGGGRPPAPALIDVVLDPMAGVESGNVHSFNAPNAKL